MAKMIGLLQRYFGGYLMRFRVYMIYYGVQLRSFTFKCLLQKTYKSAFLERVFCQTIIIHFQWLGFCIMKRRLSGTNLSSENVLPTFWRNAPVVIRWWQTKRRQVIFWVQVGIIIQYFIVDKFYSTLAIYTLWTSLMGSHNDRAGLMGSHNDRAGDKNWDTATCIYILLLLSIMRLISISDKTRIPPSFCGQLWTIT